ncbi:phenylacetic acid degradation PaaB family protein [Halostagnicola sp. A-GB9-2]|uniref:phenylacetic acid degradation PaaB family protein n=1 Tax=Halostagnicola sp. A-GB9-2 TaxID=3048066 RepID=UPI0024C07D7F|nr:phenylacetic acid degradation PaaB family protein [Halostagnicola sp. A-GB9-2]MDJ1433283.1 phenylacetic acid degradation PaaB family protein [Halostagnicola sp. A-GB9-2]
MKYEVFARINQGDDTTHIGNVTAQSDRLAKMYAYNTFDEEDWNYLTVVREENLLEVTGTQPKREVAAGE